MLINFYTFAKRENSTAQPSAQPAASFDCRLKEPCSVLNPRITINAGAAFDPSRLNYCYIPDFRRYYYISWSYIIGIWEASCSEDVLATYKDTIGGTPLYVIRASAAYDGNIIDTLYPMKSNSVFTKTTALNPFFFNPSDTSVNVANGTFVVGIAGVGYTQYVGMSQANLRTLMQTISDDYVTANHQYDAADASLSLQRSLIDPFQYIKSVKWFPVVYDAFGTDVANTYVGDYSFDVHHSYPANLWRTGTTTIVLPKHSAAVTRGSWLNAAAMKYELEYGPFGKITLDSSKACNYTNLILRHQMDYVTGSAWLEVGYSNDNAIQELDCVLSASIGVDIQLSQIYHTAESRFARQVTSTMSANANAGKYSSITKIGDVISGIGDILSAMGASLDTVGGGGGFIDMNMGITLYSQELTPVDDDVDHNGRPLCQTLTPASLGGYMLIQDGDIALPATRQENDQVKAYLEGGFYYE